MFIDHIDVIEEEIYRAYPSLLELLLIDQTTKKNIIWATEAYQERGDKYGFDKEIKTDLIVGEHTMIIQPRVMKTQQEQADRTRNHAEVFTPSWVCNAQNNLVDEQWFGRKDVFNRVHNQKWYSTKEPVVFSEKKTKDWKHYVDARRLEVACGEAPYLASRYDTVTGDKIDVSDRIGMLDRKLRIVNENTNDEKEWFKWVLRAYESIYGYEYQGDNLLLARESMLFTFWDNCLYKWNHNPHLKSLKQIALRISWNLWQMDAFTYSVPGTGSNGWWGQGSMFVEENMEKKCIIRDWRAQRKLLFAEVVEGRKKQ